MICSIAESDLDDVYVYTNVKTSNIIGQNSLVLFISALI